MTQYNNFQNIFKKERKRNKKAYFCVIKAFSRIRKNYDFRFQTFRHTDLMLPYFCLRCGGGGGDLVLYPVTMYSFKRVKFKGNNVHTMRLQSTITRLF